MYTDRNQLYVYAIILGFLVWLSAQPATDGKGSKLRQFWRIINGTPGGETVSTPTNSVPTTPNNGTFIKPLPPTSGNVNYLDIFA